jgi:two-component system, OmpR family, KDP operon response regulator KdpE
MGSDGLSLWQTIRRTSDVPLLLLSAPVTGQERARALHLGADEYLTKPIDPLEFIVRVQALLRRCRRPWLGGQQIRAGDLLLDPLSASVLRSNGPRVALTRQEFRVLVCLAAHAGQVLSADQILAAAWDTALRLNRNLVAVYIRRLRIKLERDAAKPTYIGSTMDGYVFLKEARRA